MVCEPGVCLAALLFRTKCEVKEYIVSGMRFLNPRIVSFLNGGGVEVMLLSKNIEEKNSK